MSSIQALLLALCCFSPLALGIIHNLQEEDDELVQPLEVDISPDDDLSSIAENALGPDFFAL